MKWYLPVAELQFVNAPNEGKTPMRIATILKGVAAALTSLAMARTPAHAREFGPLPGYVPPGVSIPGPNYDGPVIYGRAITPHEVVSPHERQGIIGGELYEEYGIRPNHPLTPAEQRGFVEGERVDDGPGGLVP